MDVLPAFQVVHQPARSTPLCFFLTTSPSPYPVSSFSSLPFAVKPTLPSYSLPSPALALRAPLIRPEFGSRLEVKMTNSALYLIRFHCAGGGMDGSRTCDGDDALQTCWSWKRQTLRENRAIYLCFLINKPHHIHLLLLLLTACWIRSLIKPSDVCGEGGDPALLA